MKLFVNSLDGILAHRCVASEISHKLGYVGSIETDVPAWKKARAGVTAETDEEWAKYNAVDLAVTHQVVDQLIPRVKQRQQVEALRVHHKIQEMCVGLHKIGFFVDQEERAKLEETYRNKAIGALKRIRQAADDPDLNPNSVPQLRELLYETWGISVGKGHRTKSGDPSTDDDAIRDIAARLKAKKIRLKNNPQIIELIDALRKFRRASKYLGTYIRKAVPFTQQIPYDDFSDDEDDVWLELDGDVVAYDRLDEDDKTRIKKKRSGGKKYGIVFPDGRIHADFSAHGPATQRISSSNPNCQNFPRVLRRMLRADPALRHVLVYADMDQLELRLAAARWHLTAYIRAFNTSGVDPHDLSAQLIFGDIYSRMKPCDEKARLRDFAKRFTYAVLFGALVETIHEVITSSEGQVKCICLGKQSLCSICGGSGWTDGLPFAGTKIEQTEQAYKDWTGNVPEIHLGWENELALYQKQGYIREPILGFRRDFLNAGGDSDVRNEILNFAIQSGGAAVVHLGTIDFMSLFPFDFGAQTGLVNQAHDALTAETVCDCALEEAEVKGKKIKVHEERCEAHESGLQLESSLTREVRDVTARGAPKLSVKFTAKATVKTENGLRVKQQTHWS